MVGICSFILKIKIKPNVYSVNRKFGNIVYRLVQNSSTGHGPLPVDNPEELEYVGRDRYATKSVVQYP